jgi:cysteine-S-conjugate beta-lyase
MHAVQVCDLKALTDIAHAHGALVMVDNSIMTPVYQRPLQLGADISMVSATKFVGGHSDVTGGVLAFKDAELAKRCVPRWALVWARWSQW